jgi:hypothetical protein
MSFNINQIFYNKGGTKMTKSNNDTVYNTLRLQGKIIKYLIDKGVEFISNNIEIVYSMASFQSEFDEYLTNKIDELIQIISELYSKAAANAALELFYIPENQSTVTPLSFVPRNKSIVYQIFETNLTYIYLNKTSNTVYNIPSFQNKFNEYLVNKSTGLISDNTVIIYNIPKHQNKFNEYLFNKSIEFKKYTARLESVFSYHYSLPTIFHPRFPEDNLRPLVLNHPSPDKITRVDKSYST